MADKLTELWLYITVVVAGALVAHLKEYERLHQEQQFRWHAYGFFSRMVYAGFAAYLADNAIRYFYVPGMPPQHMHAIVIGLAAVRPDPLINWMFDYLTSLANRFKGKR